MIVFASKSCEICIIMEAINDFLGDNVKDVYFGTNSHPRYTKDMITCGIMLGGIEQRK